MQRISEAELEEFLRLPRAHQERLLVQKYGPGVCLEWLDWPKAEIKRLILGQNWGSREASENGAIRNQL